MHFAPLIEGCAESALRVVRRCDYTDYCLIRTVLIIIITAFVEFFSSPIE